MLDKISNDMTGSGVLLVTGFIAYAAGAAIDPANPSTSEELESVFCAFIVIQWVFFPPRVLQFLCNASTTFSGLTSFSL